MKNRHLFLTTTMLISPTLFAMGGFNAAKADCSVTAGTGSVASPDNGDTITCSVAGGDQTSVVGDGTPGVFATINLDAGANINVSGDYAVDLESAVITLGNSATIQSDDNNTIRANEANALLNINLGESSSIRNTSGKAIYVYDDTTTIPNGDSLTVTLSGDNSEINSNDDSVYAYFIDKVSIELAGDNSRLDSSGGNAVYQRYGSQNLDLSGDSSYLASSNNTAVYTYDTDTFITLSGDNTYITGRTGVRVYDYFGSYDLSVTLSGDDASIIGVNNFGIDAYSYNGMDGVVTLSGDNTNITGATQGILFYANNYQPGYDNDLTVLLSGDGSSITSTAGDGIYVKSYGYNQSGDTNLTLTLSGDGANIASASGDGVFVSSYGYNYFGNPITNANAAVDINLSEEKTYILGGSSGIKIDAKNDATVNITLSHSNTSITGSSNDGVYIN
ncbi:MAG: hypothetical protein HRU40_19440, partial [Saprospiraceae bacterium]|nr:hypothetical protein [Saprospiraceae bacterium]